MFQPVRSTDLKRIDCAQQLVLVFLLTKLLSQCRLCRVPANTNEATDDTEKYSLPEVHTTSMTLKE